MTKKRKPMSAERKAELSAAAKAKWAERKAVGETSDPIDFETAGVDSIEITGQPVIPTPVSIEAPAEESTPRELDLERQVNEMKDMMLNFMANNQVQQQNNGGVGVGNNGKLIGEIEKYAIDSSNYEDPTIRLKDEIRLQPLAFNYNYELEYEMSVRAYETKTGVNQKEPEFIITLLRVVLNDEGLPTDKRYIARRMVFHEDPQAAMVIARDNGIDLGDFEDLDNTTTNQRLFLNEMRYLRVRDWLFDIFWPRKANTKDQIHEEVIGGTIVQVLTKSSEESSEINFDKLKSKF